MAEFYKLDETAFLETPEQRETYLAAARELGDPELLEMAERTVARAEQLCELTAAKAESCPFCGNELVVSCDSLPPVDGDDEELAELYASGVEHTACTRCGFAGFDPAQTRKLQEQLAGKRSGVDELFASGVEHQVCPSCGFVTFTEAQADEVHRRYWETRR